MLALERRKRIVTTGFSTNYGRDENVKDSTDSPTPAPSNFLGKLFDSLTERGRALLGRRESPLPASAAAGDLAILAERLLSRRGEASGVALARSLLEAIASANESRRLGFLTNLAERFGPDAKKVERAIEACRNDSAGVSAMEAVHRASEPRRQELFRRLNLAPGGTAALLRLRETVLTNLGTHPELKTVDADLGHLFSSWFNRGFLVLRRIDWTTPANILEKIIQHEAVHAIRDWDDLRSRLEPTDRRCYGFFHPQLVDEPLIFVEIALTKTMPAAVGPLLDLARAAIPAADARVAVFYSISNTQKGLEGVSFGNFLIKQVVEDLARELPGLKTFVTLSPAPGFAAWLNRERKAEGAGGRSAAAKKQLDLLDQDGWYREAGVAAEVGKALIPEAARYFLEAKSTNGRPLDSVARFHLGNGARLERLNFLGDISPKGLRQSHGLMVNYLYAPKEIEANHEAFAEKGVVAAASSLRKELRSRPPAKTSKGSGGEAENVEK